MHSTDTITQGRARDDYGHLYRHSARPRRRVFPNGWLDFQRAAWGLAGLAATALLGAAAFAVLAPVVMHR